MTFRRFLGTASVLALLAQAPAGAATVCRLSDGVDSFKVLEWNNPDDKGTLNLNYYVRDVIEQGEAARDYLMTGIFVIDPITARTRAAYYVTHAGTSATVHVEAAGQRTVRRLPQRDLAAGTSSGQSIQLGKYPAGTYHIVGISMGGGDGASLDGTDDRTVTYTEVFASGMTSCTPLAIEGSLRHFDEHDFLGTAISVPGAGVRAKTTFAFDVADDYLVGAVHHEATLYSYFDISTPSGGGRISGPAAPITSNSGRYSFIAEQAGVPARVNINVLTYSLTA